LLDLAENEGEDRDIRCEAVSALGAMQANEVVADLIKLVDSEDTALVAKTIEALGEIGSPAAIPKLIEKLYDERHAYYFGYYVYSWAEMALRRFDVPEAKTAISEAYWYRQRLANLTK
jgi:HEAT repeat protein